MSLSRQDGNLVLEGEPTDVRYRGVYVNAAEVDKMFVSLNDAGRMTATCVDGDGLAPCGTLPFFASLVEDGPRRVAQAWDIYGTVVARI